MFAKQLFAKHTEKWTMPFTFTSPDFLPQFIDKYRELSCLWDVKSRDYSNRYKRDEAVKELKELCKAVCVEPMEYYVKNKIANLRTVFKKEYKKYKPPKNLVQDLRTCMCHVCGTSKT